MRAGASLGWRIATAVAFGATAALAVTLSRGVPLHAALASAKGADAQRTAATAPRSAVTARCAASGLRISVGPGARVTTAITRYALDFTNVSRASCTLAGYPEVAAYRGDGVQVGAAAGDDLSAAARRVLLSTRADRARGPGCRGPRGPLRPGPRDRTAGRHARADGRPLRAAFPGGLHRPRAPGAGLPAGPRDRARRERGHAHRHRRRVQVLRRLPARPGHCTRPGPSRGTGPQPTDGIRRPKRRGCRF